MNEDNPQPDEPSSGQPAVGGGLGAPHPPARPPGGVWRGPIDRLEMVPPSLWTRGLTIMAVLLALGGFWAWDFIPALFDVSALSWRMVLIVISPVLIFFGYLLWRWWDTPKERRAVVFERDHVVLPAAYNSRREERVAYGDIEGIMGMQRGSSQSILIDCDGSTIAYRDDHFERPESIALLQQELFRRIRALPDADQILGRMRERQKLARIATSKPATWTKGLLAILAGYYVLELATGALEDPLGLVQLGANVPELVDQGEYFRLISANFLHGGWLHLILNGVALFFLGLALEKLMGSWRMMLVYLVGGLGGAIGSYLAGPGAMSVGASTAIFGLFGGFLALHVRFWDDLTPPFRQSVQWWVFMIGINAALPLIVPIVDYMAHLAGFVTGFAVAYAMLLPMDSLKPDARPSTAVRGVTVAITALFVVGLGQAGLYALDYSEEEREAVYAQLLESASEDETSADRINQLAWEATQREEVDSTSLKYALEAIREVARKHPDRHDIQDTLATVHHRLARQSTGEERLEHARRAVEIEVGLLDEVSEGPELLGGGQAMYASQLARFVAYHIAIDEALIDGDLIDQTPAIAFDADERTLTVEAETPPNSDANIYAVVESQGELVGLVRTCLENGEDEKTTGAAEALAEFDGEDLELRVGLVTEQGACPDRAQFWPMSDDVAAMP
ncbi:MAG: rhomboid family intramembrane serine protease [Persicimonas sp.]